jgi:hypothetical protein
MGIGDAPLEVASDVEVNNPVSVTGTDAHDTLAKQVEVNARASNTEIIRQIRYLYDLLSEPYPPA